MPCIPTFDVHTVRASTYMDDFLNPEELRKLLHARNKDSQPFKDQGAQTAVPVQVTKNEYAQASISKATKNTQYRGPSYRGRPVNKMDDKKLQTEVRAAVKDYLNQLISQRSNPAGGHSMAVTAADLLEATKRPAQKPKDKDNYLLDKFIKPSINVLQNHGIKNPNPPDACAVKTPVRRASSLPVPSEARSPSPEVLPSPTPTPTVLPSPSPSLCLTPSPTTPCPPTPCPSVARKPSIRSTSSRASSAVKSVVKEVPEPERPASIPAAGKRVTPTKLDYHWLTWKTTPTPQPPASPEPRHKSGNVPTRKKPSAAHPGRSSSALARRPTPTLPRRVPTPAEMKPHTHDNMTSPQVPSEVSSQPVFVPALKAWVSSANEYEREVAYNLFNALNGGMTATKVPTFKPRTRSAASQRSTSSLQHRGQARPNTAGVRTSMPVGLQRHPHEEEQLLKIVAKSMQNEAPTQRGYTNMSSCLRPRATHMSRPAPARNFTHENSFFMNSQRPYRACFTINPEWVSETTGGKSVKIKGLLRKA